VHLREKKGWFWTYGIEVVEGGVRGKREVQEARLDMEAGGGYRGF
jgi:hypothetical protein